MAPKKRLDERIIISSKLKAKLNPKPKGKRQSLINKLARDHHHHHHGIVVGYGVSELETSSVQRREIGGERNSHSRKVFIVL